uniref:Uncharacterized protein n=1 Tax=Anopheles atroparvus TaxID=41427 RepID=A0AAG5CXM0_ANOAO
MSPTSPTVKAPPSPILNTLGITGHHPKPTMRVSFKDRIRSLHHQDSKHHGEAKVPSLPGTIHEATDIKQLLLQRSASPQAKSLHHGPPHQPQQHHSKPSTAQTLKERIRSLGHLQRDDQLKPWSKLKLATVVSLGGSYTSLNNASEESPILKQSKRSRIKTSIPADLNLNSLVSLTPPPISSAPPTTCAPQTAFLPNRVLSCAAGEKASVSDSEVASGSGIQRTVGPGPASATGRASLPTSGSPRVRIKPKPIKLDSSPKSYMSIDDLSPEYCGLPFVKKLKILNERQKLAELESAIKTRSLSLDCTDSNTSTGSAHDPLDQLTRSQSEGSGMAHSVRSKSESPRRSDSHGLLPLSPESNETLERRQLKSILKKLSEDKAALEQRPTRDLKKLMRAQTVEGAQTIAGSGSGSGAVAGVGAGVAPRATLSPVAAVSTSDDSVSVATTIEQQHEHYYQVLHEEHHHHHHHREEHHQVRRVSPPGPAGPDVPPLADADGTRHALAVISNGDAHRGFPYDPHADAGMDLEPDATEPDTRTSLAALANQRKLIKGSLEEQEFFGEVLLGIKQVIQTHMKEIQVKFQDEFFNLELEVKKRDDIISKLQNRILELEAEQHQGLVGLQVQLPPEQGGQSSGSGSTGSSNELPFMRGDSLDTIFASSPHSDSDAPRQPKVRSRKPRTSPRHRQLRNRPTWDESTDQDSFDRKDSPPLSHRSQQQQQQPGNGGHTHSTGPLGPPPPVPPRRMSTTTTSTTTSVTMSTTNRSPYRDLVISELTGNIVSDSVILNIEATSSSQSENDQPSDDDRRSLHRRSLRLDDEEQEGDEDNEARRLVRRRRSRSRDDEDDDDDDDDDDDCEDEQDIGEELEGELGEEEGEGEEEQDDEAEQGMEEEEEEEEGLEEEEEDEEELNHNDWEVRMLAAELKKRESISTDFPTELEGGGDGLVRRRSHRKRSDTDTDGSMEGSTERDAFGRPRAASFDQHNLQRRAPFGVAGRGNGGAPSTAGHSGSGGGGSRTRGGIFKALSFDRDKDRL